MFKEIPFARIKSVNEYVLRKLKEEKVVLGVHVYDGEIRSVESFWCARDGNSTQSINRYTQEPLLEDSEPEKEYIDIYNDHIHMISEDEIKGLFSYEPDEYISDADCKKTNHHHWYYSDDIENAWGPLELELVEFFMNLHPKFKPYSRSKEKLDDLNYNKEVVIDNGFSNEIAEYIVNELPGLFYPSNNGFRRLIVHLEEELGENYAAVLNESYSSGDRLLFDKYLDVSNVDRALDCCD